MASVEELPETTKPVGSRNVIAEYFELFVSKLTYVRDWPFVYLSKNPRLTNILIAATLFALYNAYFIGCLIRHSDKGLEWEWCDGLGFLVIITAIVYVGLAYYLILVPLFGNFVNKNILGPINKTLTNMNKSMPIVMTLISLCLYLAILAGVIIFLIIDSKDEPERLTSAAGVLAFVFIGFIFSAHPDKIRWRHVFWGIGLEFTLGLLVLRWEVGKNVFECLGQKVSTFLSFTDEGAYFVYGFLSTENNEDGRPLFAFGTLCIIYFFSFCVSMLFYLGTLQWIVMKLGWLLSVTVGTTAAESLNAAANIFLGQTEAPLMIKPFLKDMTKSEIHAVMTGGFATIAGTVLGAFISFGIEADKLIAASVMAAPAALAVSKLFYPETEKSKTSVDEIKMEKGPEANVIDAAAQGASNAVMLVLNIAASLIAFLSFVAFLDAIIGWLGVLAGVDDLSFEYLLGKIFIPIAFLMGVPAEDTEKVATLVGIKTIVTEFAAFDRLGQWVEEGIIGERAAVIATYALCGFANPGSIGIQLGGIGAMAPERKTDLAQLVGRAFVAGCCTSFMNACVAGALISTK